MTKIYIIVDACSGEYYGADEPTVLFATKNAEEAKQFFESEISNWEDGLEDYDASCVDGSDETKLIYECTDFDGDSHRIMKLVEKEI